MSAATLLLNESEEKIRKQIDTELSTMETLLKTLEPLLKQAQPINSWHNVEGKVKTCNCGKCGDVPGNFTQDNTTGNLYCDDDNDTLRVKLFLLSLGTCTINAVALAINTAYRLIKLATCYELLNPENSWASGIKKYAQDVARLICGPLILIGMQITAMLGTITPMQNGPKDARKMYALGETMLFGYDGWRLAPCFRPEPESHLFGGKIGVKNAW